MPMWEHKPGRNAYKRVSYKPVSRIQRFLKKFSNLGRERPRDRFEGANPDRKHNPRRLSSPLAPSEIWFESALFVLDTRELTLPDYRREIPYAPNEVKSPEFLIPFSDFNNAPPAF